MPFEKTTKSYQRQWKRNAGRREERVFIYANSHQLFACLYFIMCHKFCFCNTQTMQFNSSTSMESSRDFYAFVSVTTEAWGNKVNKTYLLTVNILYVKTADVRPSIRRSPLINFRPNLRQQANYSIQNYAEFSLQFFFRLTQL